MNNVQAFLITYASFVASTVFVLSFLTPDRIDIYLAFFVVEFFVASDLTSPFGPADHRRKRILGLVMLVIFTAIVVQRILELLR